MLYNAVTPHSMSHTTTNTTIECYFLYVSDDKSAKSCRVKASRFMQIVLACATLRFFPVRLFRIPLHPLCLVFCLNC